MKKTIFNYSISALALILWCALLITGHATTDFQTAVSLILGATFGAHINQWGKNDAQK